MRWSCTSSPTTPRHKRTVRPLEGFRVLDVSSHGVVPIAASILADWGADVLKIEDPEHGEIMRNGTIWGVPPPEGGSSHLYHVFNRGKRSLAINLKHGRGHEVLLRLVDTADVFLTSFLSGVRQRLHIDVDDIRARRPDVVYGRNTGRGTKGPYAELGGYDATSFWSRAGLAMATSVPGQEIPTAMPAPAFGDSQTGFALAAGVVTALLKRERTGEGTVVDTALLATGMWAMQTAVTGSCLIGAEEFRRPPRGANAPLVNSYRTKDGRHIHMCMDQQHYWESFCDAVGRREWKTDPLIATHESREANASYCVGLMDELFAGRTLVEWKEVLSAQRGPFDPAQKTGELVDDPQVIANGYLAQVEDDAGRTLHIVAPPVQFDGERYETHRGPDHGADTDEVLTELGYDMDEIIQLKIDGAIG
jgi:crotonobetainyl-CoA:carnitine CoA-transferase CaiB-like acyl-CoA transferase